MGCLCDHSGNQLKYIKHRDVGKTPYAQSGFSFSHQPCTQTAIISRTHGRVRAKHSLNPAVPRKSRRLSTLEQSDKMSRTRSSYKTSGDLHKKYGAALRKGYLCKPTILDELPEFRRDLLEALRQPMESGRVVVSRVKDNVVFPARFMLAAAMNPCPCGYYGDEEKECRCNAFEVLRYQKKVSGPLLDRIDLQVTVPRVKIEQLQATSSKYLESDALRNRIIAARELQKERFKRAGISVLTNSEMSSKQCEVIIDLDTPAKQFLKQMSEKALLSARSYYRIMKTARTIADLSVTPRVTIDHLAEAFQYRLKEAQ